MPRIRKKTVLVDLAVSEDPQVVLKEEK